jgi:heptosyltransferase-2
MLLTIACWIFHRSRRAGNVPARGDAKRILLVNGAHIGDVIISTSVIPILRSAYPSAEIGFLTGTWSRMVVEDHPEIQHVHVVDHWALNRSPISHYRKWLQYRKSRASAVDEIRAVGYDIAIGLYTFEPDLLDLAWMAGIPIRIGFRKFFAVFATRLVEEPTYDFTHQGTRQANLLRALQIEPIHFDKQRPVLGPTDSEAIAEVQAVLALRQRSGMPYRIVHMGSGAPFRELPWGFWRDLAERLSEKETLLFTGRGNRENANIEKVIEGLPNCISACDRISWKAFVAAVRYAELLYGVESMAGHVAAAVGTRSIVMYTGVSGVARWRPQGPLCTVFSNPVPCSPCHRAEGCSEMTCLHAASPKDLVTLG